MRYRNCYRVFLPRPRRWGKTNCHLETAVEPSANCLITDPDDPGEFEHLLSRCRHKKHEEARSVLIFDQFEEIFTLFESIGYARRLPTPSRGPAEQLTQAKNQSQELIDLQRSILDAILKVVNNKELRVKVLLNVREDFVGKLEILARDYPRVLDYRVRLQYFSTEEAKIAILRPFGKKESADGESAILQTPESKEFRSPLMETGSTRDNPFASRLTESLAVRIVDDLNAVTPGEGVSPTQVQIVCGRLWQAYASRTSEIGEPEYVSLEGVKGILEGFLESELNAIQPAKLRPIAVTIFGGLITTLGTRDVVSRDKLRGVVGSRTSGAEFSDTLKFLESRRLINATFERGTYFYEVASEYLIPPIQKKSQLLAVEQAAAEAKKRAKAQRQRANKLRRALAEARSRELITSSLLSQDIDPEISVLLAAHAVAATWQRVRTVLPEAEEQLHRAILASLVRITMRGHDAFATSVAWSPLKAGKEERLATGSWDSTAKVWDAAAGKELLTLSGHRGLVTSVAWSPDGNRLATGSGDNTAKVWDAETSRELLTLSGHSGSVWSVAWSSPDGKQLATGSDDNAAKVWDAATGKELLTLSGHTSLVNSLAWHPDPDGKRLAMKRLATASGDHTAKVWDAATGKELLTLSGHVASVRIVAWSPDGKQLATGSNDKATKVWDGKRKELLTLMGHSDLVNSVAWSPDGKRMATGSWDGKAKVWKGETGKDPLNLSGQTSSVFSVTWSPDGKRLATGSADKTAKLWDAETGKDLLTLSGHRDFVNDVDWSQDGNRLVTGSADKTAKLWDAETGKELLTLTGHSDPVLSVAWSPDGNQLATGSDDRTAKVWDVETGKELLTLRGHSDSVTSVTWSPDGKRLATSSRDRTAKVWDAETGKELLTLRGHHGPVESVAWRPPRTGKEERMATGSGDTTAKVWDAETGEELLTLTGHSGSVRSVAWGPDGKRLATASDDGTVQVYAMDIHDLMALAQQRVTAHPSADGCKRFLHVDKCPAVPKLQT